MTGRAKFWLISAAALLAVAATLSLGRWQLSRATQKQTLQERIDAQATLPALDGPALLRLVDPRSALHRKVTLRGHWMTRHTVYLDNRSMSAKVGLYLLTPLQLEGSASVLMVQRGWVARNFLDRNRVPTLPTPGGLIDIEGRIAPSPAKLYELGEAQNGPIRQNLDLTDFRDQSGLGLLPVSVLQTGPTGDGLLRDWPLTASGVDKHYGYAFQWFGLSALITFLYVWFQIVRRVIQTRRV